MINRRSFVKLAAAGAAAGSFGMPWIARAAKPITLKLADSLPTTHYSMPIIKHWIKQIEEGTEGRIRFEHYPAEQLASARDLLVWHLFVLRHNPAVARGCARRKARL